MHIALEIKIKERLPIENRDVKIKLIWLSRVVFVFFIIAILKVGYIQFIKSDDLQAEIIKERVREEVLLPERGNILDKRGNILAMSLVMQDVAVNPNLIVSKKHEQKVAKVLSDNIKELSYDDALKLLKDKKSKYKVIAKQVPPNAAKLIRESGVGGIQISQTTRRLYPSGNTGGTVLGFVNNNSEPGAGIEIKMNEFLAGKNGYRLGEMTPFGEVIPVGSQNVVSPVDGQNVQLTIDSYMQHVLETGLQEAVDRLHPQEIHAVIMDPNNGDVLAMASYPSYNPNEYQKSSPKAWTTTPANFLYEPGSIFKPIFMTAALDAGALDGDEVFPTGTTYVNGTRIRDWNRGQGWGPQRLEGIIKNSSNVGMINVANSMTNKQIVESFDKTGIGLTTGIELPGEQATYNRPTAKSLSQDPVRRANISFGQGIMVTPVQMITAFSEIVNGGHKIVPTLVKQVTDKNNNVIYAPQKPKDRVFSEDSTSKMRGYLKTNMEEGSGRTAQVPGYDGGGKTGSAWYVENGGYVKGKIIGSFIGFYPYKDPKYSIIISVKAPQGVEFGSDAANPIAKSVMTEILRYEGVSPTTKVENGGDDSEETTTEGPKETVQVDPIDVPDTLWKLYKDAEKELHEKFGDKVTVKHNGKGEVVTDLKYSYESGKLAITLITSKIKDGNAYYIPDFIGKTEEEANSILSKYKINYRIHGKNEVVEQNLAPGQYFKLDNFQLWTK
ncbi:penicillin-binding transpeptidase domain-containing protein [Bacillus thuringiensis]|uniref:penicillin-binding transpeptidase domain-containing protein n=1 Tax=Bacillus thuringiensis TaxID=1428 RepID=UPI0021D64E72|nr:penicillin-binding transpeptidase domain-containing protein [Bacillus thuringiensis]MCU7666929.1 penicillin-binding transpeptidase domain-containing protein [Bacillus thuringiensis]